MTPHFFSRITPAALAATALLCSGCVARGYKMADQKAPPVVALNYTSSAPDSGAAAPATEAVVQTVIVYGGPGSWKREAYWDEYVLSFTNRGAKPVALTGASLHANNGDVTAPGLHPWQIENAGKSWWKTNAGDQARTYLLLGGGAVAGAGVGAWAVGATLFGPLTGAYAVGATVGAATVVALPLVAIGSVGMNIRGKRHVEAEFNRRRLVLPRTVEPGETVQGSLFFRITPSPRELVLHSTVADAASDVKVSLAPLSGLHMSLPVAPAPKS